MEVDNGAAVSVISEEVMNDIPDMVLQPSNLSLATVTGEKLNLAGEAQVTVEYKGKSKKLPIVVVTGNTPSLLGRTWLTQIELDWSKIQTVYQQKETLDLNTVLEECAEVFSDELGTMKGVKIDLEVKPGTIPKFCKSRPVPFALKERINTKLEHLIEMGVLEKVSYNDWASPSVNVVKPDGDIRICGDYKVTVNQFLEVDKYPLPRPEELFATLNGGAFFFKLDMTHAYEQLVLSESSRNYVTINTHQGLYRYTRLPFGIASAPALFQKEIDKVLSGLPGVVTYLDDVLGTGRTEQETLKRLKDTLLKFQEFGLKLKRSKCDFLKESVEFLGHTIDAQGVHTSPQKVSAMVNAPRPTNEKELKSFIGLVNYYGKFVPNMSTLLHPLLQLQVKENPWKWDIKCEEAFNRLKQALSTAPVLAHYDVDRPLKLACDASSVGLGAVISHIMEDGTEKPISFASRTLSSSEKNYSQIDKEALAIVFGVKKYHQYLYGRHFMLVTDHQPLLKILGSKCGIPPIAAARLQRYAILLSAYHYEIQFRKSEDNANADALSRLPLPVVHPRKEVDIATILNRQQVEALPMSSEDIRRATRTDPVCSQVLEYTVTGWPEVTSSNLNPFSSRRLEITCEDGCLLWGRRVIVPAKLCPEVLKELYSSHAGVVRMKCLARQYVWWPGLDSDIEQEVARCFNCQTQRNAPPKAPTQPWTFPLSPWQRVHLDFAGPVEGKMLLIIVDAFSKWIEVIVMGSTTSTKTIEAIRPLFAAYGLPRQIVTDNGPQFRSEEFAEFTRLNGIKHSFTSPYHPATNGEAERAVQTIKQALKKSTQGTFEQRLSRFLLLYRVTPHSLTEQSPSELFLRRRLRTRMDLWKPDLQEKVTNRKNQVLEGSKTCERDFVPGNQVMIRDYRPTNTKWIPGIVLEKTGTRSYRVQSKDGEHNRHVDQMLQSGLPQDVSDTDRINEADTIYQEIGGPNESFEKVAGERVPGVNPEKETAGTVNLPSVESSPSGSEHRRYPQRARHPPNRLNL